MRNLNMTNQLGMVLPARWRLPEIVGQGYAHHHLYSLLKIREACRIASRLIDCRPAVDTVEQDPGRSGVFSRGEVNRDNQ